MGVVDPVGEEGAAAAAAAVAAVVTETCWGRDTGERVSSHATVL